MNNIRDKILTNPSDLNPFEKDYHYFEFQDYPDPIERSKCGLIRLKIEWFLKSIFALVADFIEDIERTEDTVTTSRNDILAQMPSWQFLLTFLIFGFLSGFTFASMLNSYNRGFKAYGGSRTTLGNSLYDDDS